MTKGLVIADAGPIFSLAIIDELELLNQLFEKICIPKAVWEEVSRDRNTDFYSKIEEFFEPKVVAIKGFNELTFVMDYGESESVILYKELQADFLLIDDKKARNIAENFNIKCIGTLGILSSAKSNNFVKDLRPFFKKFLEKDRYYSIELLNRLLEHHGETKIDLEEI